MSRTIETVSVFGLGKLGGPIAKTLSDRGFHVVGIDPPKNVLHPSFAVDTDASFFAVPTPSLSDGSFSPKALIESMTGLAAELKLAKKEGHLFVCCSTVTPGDCLYLMNAICEVMDQPFGFCYNPQFIALGEVEKGLLEPDLVLIGESDKRSGDALEALYDQYTLNLPSICRMSLISAELTKIALNSYITTKISFTNQIRMIAERISADTHLVLEAIGKDSRVGPKYLQSGLSYGGPCFPRDNRLLAYTARKWGVDAPLALAADAVNERTKNDLEEKVRGSGAGTIVILGLAYKPGTDITEESIGYYLAKTLVASGYHVLVNDPAASTAGFDTIALDDIKGLSDALVVVCTPWLEFGEVDIGNLKSICPFQFHVV